MAREVEVDILEALQGVKVKVMVDSDGTCRMNDPLSKSVYAHARKLAAEEAKAEGPYYRQQYDVFMETGSGAKFVDQLGSIDGAANVVRNLNSAHAAWLAQEPPKVWGVFSADFNHEGKLRHYLTRHGELTAFYFDCKEGADEEAKKRQQAFEDGWQRKGGAA